MLGYYLNRFVKEVDFELRCPICHFVLKDAVESQKCQHIYCDDCIKTWLINNKTCPVDKMAMSYNDVKLATRVVRNLLNKLEIKCDFGMNSKTLNSFVYFL
jgi:E3 ubiquitin-protein ligase NRDP1